MNTRWFSFILCLGLSTLGFSALVLAGEPSAYSNYFYSACNDPSQYQKLSSKELTTGGFGLPLSDRLNQANIFQLSNYLISKVQNKIKQSHTLNQNIQNCEKVGPSTAACEELLVWLSFEVPKYVSEARQHLALAQSPADIMSWLSLPRIELNQDMSLWNLFKEEQWEPLSNEEITLAHSRLVQYAQKAYRGTEAKRQNGELSKFQSLKLTLLTVLLLRYQHYVKYKSMLGALSLMQYLKSAQPKTAEILNAITQLEFNLKKEEQQLDVWKLALVQTQIKNQFDSSLLDLFSYSNLLEEILIEHPQFCPLAAGVLEYREDRNLVISLSIGLPILATSFLVPPLPGFALGLGSGLGYAAFTQLEINQDKVTQFDSIYGDENNIDLDKVSELKRSRDLGLILLPLTSGLMRILQCLKL